MEPEESAQRAWACSPWKSWGWRAAFVNSRVRHSKALVTVASDPRSSEWSWSQQDSHVELEPSGGMLARRMDKKSEDKVHTSISRMFSGVSVYVMVWLL